MYEKKFPWWKQNKAKLEILYFQEGMSLKAIGNQCGKKYHECRINMARLFGKLDRNASITRGLYRHYRLRELKIRRKLYMNPEMKDRVKQEINNLKETIATKEKELQNLVKPYRAELEQLRREKGRYERLLK